MPVSYTIDSASQTVLWLMEGNVTDQELIDATRVLWAGHDYAPQYDRLIDATRADSALVTGEALRKIAVHASMDRVKRIALVGNQHAVYGMFRVFQAYVDGVECEIFSERTEVLRWLAAQPLGAGPADNKAVAGSGVR